MLCSSPGIDSNATCVCAHINITHLVPMPRLLREKEIAAANGDDEKAKQLEDQVRNQCPTVRVWELYAMCCL